MKKTISTMLMCALSMGIMAGCGTSTTESTDGETELVWYLRHEEQREQDLVTDAINKVLKEKINAKLVIKRVDNYPEKIKLAIAANEKFDICHMAPRYDYYSHVAKRAFLPLNELLPAQAPKTYEMIPQKFWDATKVDGEIYGVINYQIVARQHGYVVQEYALDKYDFDITTIKEMEDIEPLFMKMKEGEPSNVTILQNSRGALYSFALTHYIGFDVIGTSSQPGAVMVGDTSLKVINQYETENFKNFVNLMRDWYVKGYIQKDAATSTSDVKSQGLVMSWVDMVGPGFEPNFAKMLGNRPVKTVIFDPPFVNSESVIATMNSVSRTSSNPEKAMQFLEMLNNNEGDIYNMMCFGIEGRHFNKISDTRIEKIPDTGYDPNASWMFGNQFNAYLLPGQEDGLWEATKELNERADTSLLMGFSFDVNPMKIEIAQCQAVMDEYIPSLCTGSVDPDVYLPEFIDKLKKANVDKIIEEKQRQVDEWKAQQ